MAERPQCRMLTKAGQQCSRPADEGGGPLCWQHSPARKSPKALKLRAVGKWGGAVALGIIIEQMIEVLGHSVQIGSYRVSDESFQILLQGAEAAKNGDEAAAERLTQLFFIEDPQLASNALRTFALP